MQKYPKLRVRLVDGTSLAAAVVVNSIPQGTDQVILAGNVSKVARAVATVLCKKNVKVRNNSYICFMLVTCRKCCFH
jgi:aldehyde decarbonylase